MHTSKQVGDAGENYATEFLRFKGFEIMHRNWRSGKLEIDIVAKDKNRLVFVEVKSRLMVIDEVHPEDKVNADKQRKLILAAQHYLMKNPHNGPLRFDIVSVVISHFSRCLYYHPDAFFPMGS